MHNSFSKNMGAVARARADTNLAGHGTGRIAA